jgi:hypothetical protein
MPRTQPSLQHGGFFIQSQAGESGDFEIVVPWSSGGLAHYRRANDAVDHPWTGPTLFGADIYISACLLETDWQSTEGHQYNLEVIAVTSDGILHVFWRDNGPAFTWNGPTVLLKEKEWGGNANLTQGGSPVQEGRRDQLIQLSAKHRPFHLIALRAIRRQAGSTSGHDSTTDGGFQYWQRVHLKEGERIWHLEEELVHGAYSGAGMVFSTLNSEDSPHRNEYVYKYPGEQFLF